ncbi:MAG: hypothetical protein ACTSQG_11695, partial [Promethearchaeota archaeon]
MKNDIVQVKFKISVPKIKWIAKINNKYPNLDFKILSKSLIANNIGNTLFLIKGKNIKSFLSDFKNLVMPSEYQIFFESSDSLLINVKSIDPLILKALIKTQLLLIYPLTIKNGKILINAIAERAKIDSFLTELEKKKI